MGLAQKGDLHTQQCLCDKYSNKWGCSAASLAQSAARQSHNLKVVSSSLTGGTFFIVFLFIFLHWTGECTIPLLVKSSVCMCTSNLFFFSVASDLLGRQPAVVSQCLHAPEYALSEEGDRQEADATSDRVYQTIPF